MKSQELGFLVLGQKSNNYLDLIRKALLSEKAYFQVTRYSLLVIACPFAFNQAIKIPATIPET